VKAPRFDGEHKKKSLPRISRREALFGLTATGIVAGGYALERISEEAKEDFKKETAIHEREAFEKNIRTEMTRVAADVRAGIAGEERTARTIAEYNEIVGQLQKLPRDSKPYQALVEKANKKWDAIQPLEMENGLESALPLPQATSYANALLENPKAVRHLALMRVFYREALEGYEYEKIELPYWHNMAFAYLQLVSISESGLKKKSEELVAYMQKEKLYDFNMKVEDLVYAFIDPEFDFSLTAEKMTAWLSVHAPQWKAFPATHMNKDSYLHYNDLSQLSVFELNRLQAVVRQLGDSRFVASVFATRKEDLNDTQTEFGGIVPRPDQAHAVRRIPGTTKNGNGSYVIPNESAVEIFGSAAQFHLHATQMRESLDAQGPSGGDSAFFGPGVVFSSINEETLLVHFFTSRRDWHAKNIFTLKNDVVCIGTIKKTAA
jgi:hypothetical protein